jgi:hypothetical protein
MAEFPDITEKVTKLETRVRQLEIAALFLVVLMFVLYFLAK